MNFLQYYYLQTESKHYPLLDSNGEVVIDSRGNPILNMSSYEFEKARREINDLQPLPPPRPEWGQIIKIKTPKPIDKKIKSWLDKSVPPEDLKNETNQSAVIQGNNYGDFPMTTFQSASELLPTPGSNTANKISKRKKQYIKPGNRKVVPKYNVGRVNMNMTMLPYQTNSSSL